MESYDSHESTETAALHAILILFLVSTHVFGIPVNTIRCIPVKTNVLCGQPNLARGAVAGRSSDRPQD